MRHTLLGEHPQPVELRKHHCPEIRPILSPELRALERQPGENQSLLNWPVLHLSIQHLLKRPFLDGPVDVVDVGFNPEHARLLVLWVDVTEGASCRGHAVLCDSVGHGGWDKSSEADVTDLADEVSVEEDVGGLEVAVDEGLGFRLVEEEESCSDLGCDSETGLPGKGRGVAAPEEAVLEAAVGHTGPYPPSPILRFSAKYSVAVSISSMEYLRYLTSFCASLSSTFFFSSASLTAFISALILFWDSSSASL
ncbi:acid phosphatase/vanadium-dependenthaloperoxidase-related protein [Striga asiatica]|uniref:Acid phosphatase/vanadium-dependenthaloperoxidase-related protein n=1 Tax=Striga asiatica TaxID=4170 RepID=A0A5A7QCB1_STRAF|nr:acid phosphatase/vanadium-dependenthaloperoxidase-related protein [Striga asiatica]